MGRVTGLGGVFFKTDDPAATRDWYRRHLGIESEDWGKAFLWRESDRPAARGYTVWSPFRSESDYFAPSEKPFMVNYRVEGLEDLLTQMREAGVEIAGEMVEEPNGRFAWILDPDGHKIELWEPIDSAQDPYLPPLDADDPSTS